MRFFCPCCPGDNSKNDSSKKALLADNPHDSATNNSDSVGSVAASPSAPAPIAAASQPPASPQHAAADAELPEPAVVMPPPEPKKIIPITAQEIADKTSAWLQLLKIREQAKKRPPSKETREKIQRIPTHLARLKTQLSERGYNKEERALNSRTIDEMLRTIEEELAAPQDLAIRAAAVSADIAARVAASQQHRL